MKTFYISILPFCLLISCSKSPNSTSTPQTDIQAPTIPSGLSGTATSNSVSLTWNASTDNVLVIGYKIYRGGILITSSTSTSYTDNGLTASTQYSYTVSAYDAANNNSVQSTAFVITTSAPPLTAVFTAVDASTTASLKSLPGNSVAKAIVLNVTTAGTAKLETIGALTSGNSAIGYYWITGNDSSDLNQSASTLNPIAAKTTVTASQIISLKVGTNVICFKTVPYKGTITNNTNIGVKVTGASSVTVANASYTCDATSANVANVVRIYFKDVGGVKAAANLQTTGFACGDFQLLPYNDESGSVYDSTLYPLINYLSYDIFNTSWISPTTGYTGIDFTNAQGPAGMFLGVGQVNINGVSSLIFQNSDAILSNGIVQFTKTGGVKLLTSVLGKFSYCNVGANIYNPTSIQFGPSRFCWYLKSIKFVGNPELWIYDPSGTRIW